MGQINTDLFVLFSMIAVFVIAGSFPYVYNFINWAIDKYKNGK